MKEHESKFTMPLICDLLQVRHITTMRG